MKSAKNPDRRRFTPELLALEAKRLLSTSALIASGALRTSGGPAPIVANAGGDSPYSYSFPLRTQPFSARFRGPYIVGGPRAAGEFSQTYMFGGGNSSAFLHGDIQLGLSTPLDPSQPIVGQALLIVKNVSDTGNELVLDLTTVAGAVDSRGRPTLFTFTQNDSSGGTFAGGEASGTMKLIYQPGSFPGQRNLRNARASGTLGVIFQGTIGTTNLNLTRNS